MTHSVLHLLVLGNSLPSQVCFIQWISRTELIIFEYMWANKLLNIHIDSQSVTHHFTLRGARHSAEGGGWERTAVAFMNVYGARVLQHQSALVLENTKWSLKGFLVQITILKAWAALRLIIKIIPQRWPDELSWVSPLLLVAMAIYLLFYILELTLCIDYH